MINKTVIRRDNKSGEFTTIHKSILNDTRLSPTAFRLLVSILSDSNEFTLSQTLYKKRLGITENREYLKAITNLEDCGYLKKTQIGDDKFIPKVKKANSKKVVYHYTISEYGNLNKKLELEQEEIQLPTSINIDNETTLFIQSISGLLNDDEFYKFFMDVVSNASSVQVMKKLVNDFLKKAYKDELAKVVKPESNKKAFKELQDWLKVEIFTNFNLGFNINKKWTYTKLKHRKPDNFDYETQLSDYYESAKD
jgi:hypothetical protein